MAKTSPLCAEKQGYFRGFVEQARAGARYRFRLDQERETFPDPASRFQPDGPHGPSEVIDSTPYSWRDDEWSGIDTNGLVICEIHIGTFTTEGTWRAAMQQLKHLSDVGINILEVMPVHEFPGRFGWGYDGVDLWAPTRLYGSPDDFRAFVDAAHAARIAVILDVVYNHFGPDGSNLDRFTKAYFTDRYDTEWGQAINFDGVGCEGVREFVSENAAYWIDEFHLDGLRLDATQSIHDASPENVITLAARRARESARGRRIFLVAENEPQDVRLLHEFKLDAMWNDDWHHSAIVAVTGKREAYYTDYRGSPQEFVSMAKSGFLYQGQWYSWQKNRRGTPSRDVPAERLVCYLENHDQVANSARGARLHQFTTPGRFRALTALLLLGPNTPMLFQGEEFGSSKPFLYFADHKPELAAAVDKGRKKFLSQFSSIAAIQEQLARPDDPRTFESCKLDHSERDAEIVALHRDLLRLRRSFRIASVDGAVLAEEALVLRFTSDHHGERLLIVNLGPELILDIMPEPLFAPPRGSRWEMLWSSEPAHEIWQIPREAAVLWSGGVT
jgi:maltooligosyltrehalose trehalohydrolase